MKPVPFTLRQSEALDVERHLDMCVVAGPGSGKTTLLVGYFRRLVDAGVDPQRIVAITFTEKAAANMRQKLAEAFSGNAGARAGLERAWVSTIHGFCARLLHEYAVFAGVDPEFTVADERESLRIQQEAITAAIESLFDERPAPVRDLIRGLESPDFEEAVRSAYDAMRCAGMSVEEAARMPAPAGKSLADVAATLDQLTRAPLPAWSYSQKRHCAEILEGARRIVSATGALEAMRAIEAFPTNLRKCKSGTAAYDLIVELRGRIKETTYSLITEHYASERHLLLEVLRRFDALYRERKRQAGLLDFADLEEFMVRLLDGHREARAQLQSQFDHILMDELQDTNPQQAKLLAQVRTPGRFYAVGDVNQAIFGFRHADPQAFRDYRSEVVATGARHVELIENFRSRPDILRLVQTIADGLAGIEPRSLVAARQFEEARSVCVEVISVSATSQQEQSALESEARWVARRAAELSAEFEYRDIAILVRNTEILPAFTAAFDEAGLPYLVNRGRGFYDTREVSDLGHLLRAIANPRDEISLAVVLRSPLVGVSDEALLRLKLLGGNLGASLLGSGADGATDGWAEFDPFDRDKLLRFRDRLREWRIRREYVTFDRLLLAAMDDCGYRPDAGARGAANIDKFLAQARAAATHMSLDEWVEELALVRASNPREPDAPPQDSENAIQVMTVHSAKGLEFPVVFVAAMHKGVETEPPVVAFSQRYGLGARWRNPAGGRDKDDLFQHQVREERKDREAEEGHRLLYVAMTRAEQHLILSFSGKKWWAADVAKVLHLDLDACHVETLTRTAPDGKEFQLRLLVTDRAPEPEAVAVELPSAHAGQAEFLPPPAVTEQQDANATVTGLASFASCPRRYFLGQYLGFEGRVRSGRDADGEADTDLPAGDFGTQVHKLLAGVEVAEPDPEALRLADIFRNSALGRRAARARHVEREFDFLMAVEDLVLRGQLDLWFEEGGETVIVDYKTDAVTTAEAHQRALDYAPQLRLYASAVERMRGSMPDRAWLYFLRPNAPVEVSLAPSLLESPEQLAREFQEAQSKMEFPLNEGERCRTCPFYRGLCPSAYIPPHGLSTTEIRQIGGL